MSSTRSSSPGEPRTMLPWPSQLCAAKPATASGFDLQAYLRALSQQRSLAARSLSGTPMPTPARIQKPKQKGLQAPRRRSQRLRRAQKAP